MFCLRKQQGSRKVELPVRLRTYILSVSSLTYMGVVPGALKYNSDFKHHHNKHSDNVLNIVTISRMWQRHKISKCFLKNGTDRFAQCTAAINIQFVKQAPSEKCRKAQCNKQDMPIVFLPINDVSIFSFIPAFFQSMFNSSFPFTISICDLLPSKTDEDTVLSCIPDFNFLKGNFLDSLWEMDSNYAIALKTQFTHKDTPST